MKKRHDEFFRKEDEHILFITGTIWRKVLETKRKRDNEIFRKILRFFGRKT